MLFILIFISTLTSYELFNLFIPHCRLIHKQWGYANFSIDNEVNNFSIATFPMAFNNYTSVALALDILNNDATEYKPIHVLTWSKSGDTKNNIKFVTDDGNSVQAIGYFVIGK